MKIWNDYPTGSVGFQDPGTDQLFKIIHFHDTVIFWLVILGGVVLVFFISSVYERKEDLSMVVGSSQHGNLIEVIWTLIPACILWCIGLPSLRLLYIIDEVLDPELTVKAVGFQWAWSYELTDFKSAAGEGLIDEEKIIFESYPLSVSELELGDHRLLAVDNYLNLPINTSIRILTTSTDVIHSFTVPSLGIKADSIPGRINAMGLHILRPSTYYGQCSELCGYNHSFMPIGLKAVSVKDFILGIKG